MYASNSIPTTQTISGINDWLLCDGSAFSTSTYVALYNVIGDTFGTSGANFLVPDFRTYSPVGVGGSFVLGTSVTASAATGTDVIKLQPINFIIKT
jgi:microcystin-dependent protein